MTEGHHLLFQRPVSPATPRVSFRKLLSPAHILLQACVAALFFVGDELDRVFHLWFALVPILGIPAIVVFLVWVVGLVRNALRREWVRVASIAIAPLIVWPLLILLLRSGFDSHWIRFQFTRQDYVDAVRALQAPHPAYHSWNWGTTGGAAAVNIFRTLVYDETGQVALKQSEDRNGGITRVRSLGEHFYLVTEIYQ